VITKKRNDNIVKFYYFKNVEKELYYNVAEDVENGRLRMFLYSITKAIK
jgi:hypothetical protein